MAWPSTDTRVAFRRPLSLHLTLSLGLPERNCAELGGGGHIMRRRLGAMPASLLFGAGLFLLSACGGIQIGSDALVKHLPPGQDQVCRAAVREALAQRNVSQDWIKRVHYQALRTGSRIAGFEAWVYPKDGRGALVVELSATCQVRRIWAHGTR